MKGRNKILAGIDIGGSRISVIVGELQKDNAINVIGIWQQPSDGLKHGAIVNVDLASNAIKKALSNAEESTGYNIDFVYVSIADNRIDGRNSFAVVVLEGGEVSKEDIISSYEIVKAVRFAAGRQLLDFIPQRYIVDSQVSLDEPIGKEGVRLETYAHLVTCPTASIQKTIQAVEKAGITINGIVAKHIAAAIATTKDSERDLGVIVIDIGDTGTGVVAYKSSVLLRSTIIPLGGSSITSDIAQGLRVSTIEAERVKVKFGCAFLPLAKKEEDVEIFTIGAREKIMVRHQSLAWIIQARLEEIMHIAYEEVASIRDPKTFASGVIITGATAMTEGICELTQKVFNLPVRIGVPVGVDGLVELVDSPQCATAAGLLIQCALVDKGEAKGIADSKHVGAVTNKIKKMFTDFL